MANGQFIIPGTQENHALRQQVDEAFDEIFADNPEIKTVFDEINEIQVELEMKRSFATEANLPRTFGKMVASLFAPTPRPLEERLIEEESKIGGEIFANE